MARSIHENRSRRSIAEGRVDWEAIAKKRRVKTGARGERGISASDPSASQSASSLPIRVVDSGGPLFYPASVDDMREVLSRLPPGSLDGLHSVTLESGRLYVNKASEGGDPDPILGRGSVELLAGIYAPVILGTYNRRSMKISVFAFVRAPGVEVGDVELIALRLRMLATLVHEVAHHHDRSRCTARGRWRMDDTHKAESLADRLAVRWFRECVIPFVRDRYGPGSATSDPTRS